jgi:hypothetical protein
MKVLILSTSFACEPVYKSTSQIKSKSLRKGSEKSSVRGIETEGIDF